MKRFLLAIVAVNMVVVCSAKPIVSEDEVRLNQVGSKVEVTYVLRGEPAVVLVELQTNTVPATMDGEWVSIGAEHSIAFKGDANCINDKVGEVSKVSWKASDTWPQEVPLKGVRAKVTAWATTTPPDYMVADLTETNAVRFYATAEAVPFGISNELYKTTSMVMRKIHAAGERWHYGALAQDIGSMNAELSRSFPHDVVLSEDFYVGVYELTQKQFETITGKAGLAWFNDRGDSDIRPMECISYAKMRGDIAAYSWPANGHQVGGYLAMLRNLTGVEFDLPTMAQWQFATRGGDTGQLYNGLEYTAENSKSVAWSNLNSGDETHPVGMLAPNRWGLYDTLGNVSETVLEGGSYVPGLLQEAGKGVVVDPTCTAEQAVNIPVTPIGASSSGRYFVYAGGGFKNAQSMSRSYYYTYMNNPWFNGEDRWQSGNAIGYRLVAPAGVSAR